MKFTLKRLFAVCLLGSAVILQAADETLANHRFAKQLHGWNSPGYWAGKTTLVTENGAKYMQLVSGTRGKEVFGRALTYSRQIEYYAGDTIRIDVRAKGEGILQTGVLIYAFNSGSPEYVRCPEQKLSSEFQTFTVKASIPRRLRMVLPFMEIKGQGKMLVESFLMKAVSEKGVKIKSSTSMQIVGPQSKIQPVKFKTSLKNAPVTICQKLNKSFTEKTVNTADDGSLSFQPEIKETGLTEISAAAKGVHASAYICLENAEDFSKTQNTAKNIKLQKPLRILMLGDSLSDFYRGYNYLDRLNFWLNQYNPGKASIRNAGVGGDYLTRVEERLCGTLPQSKSKAYRQYMYNNLFKQQYDLIFIFLGQNDTRCWRKEKFAAPLIDPAKQEKTLQSILKLIRKHSQAKIVLLSPSPSNLKVFTDREAKMKPGQNMVMYGKKEFVDAYDAVNRKICKEQKLDYIDILTPMRSSSNIASLYVADGVHLSPAGGRLIADELLKYLASQKF